MMKFLAQWVISVVIANKVKNMLTLSDSVPASSDNQKK